MPGPCNAQRSGFSVAAGLPPKFSAARRPGVTRQRNGLRFKTAFSKVSPESHSYRSPLVTTRCRVSWGICQPQARKTCSGILGATPCAAWRLRHSDNWVHKLQIRREQVSMFRKFACRSCAVLAPLLLLGVATRLSTGVLSAESLAPLGQSTASSTDLGFMHLLAGGPSPTPLPSVTYSSIATDASWAIWTATLSGQLLDPGTLHPISEFPRRGNGHASFPLTATTMNSTPSIARSWDRSLALTPSR